jgi:undecaprenyl-diphosphatase
MTWLRRLDAHDRRLYDRWALDASATMRRRRTWRALTTIGGARVSIALALAPWLLVWGAPALAASAAHVAHDAGWTLALSHAVVQLVKRSAGRARPSRAADAPDPFSFPSGHACASLAVMLPVAAHWPWLGGPAVLLAILVGHSRVVLGVHYPGDVAVGQAIAVMTALAVITP